MQHLLGNLSNTAQEPVTVVVKRRIKPGKEEQYEQWLHQLIEDASHLPGYLGTNIHRPSSPSLREYTSVFRFDSLEHLEAFEQSDLRKRALAQVGDYVESDAVWTKLTGLEFWFTPPPGTVVPQPSRFRMAILLICVVYGLVLSIGSIVSMVFATLPFPVRLLVTITLEVFFMTYILMPWLTKKLARFLYASS